jgi:hypothetical protein
MFDDLGIPTLRRASELAVPAARPARHTAGLRVTGFKPGPGRRYAMADPEGCYPVLGYEDRGGRVYRIYSDGREDALPQCDPCWLPARVRGGLLVEVLEFTPNPPKTA